jgi:uncharacterized protein YfaS (alpha-2-macroglobulin family)
MLRAIFAMAFLAVTSLGMAVTKADSDIIIRFASESSDGQLVEDGAPLRTTELQIVSERPVPQACFTFNRFLDRSPKTAMENYVQVEPATELAAIVRDRTLCLEGFAHGREYHVTLLSGLPSVGSTLELAEEHVVKIGAMRPSIAFASEGKILPRLGNEGLPIRTVNLDRVQVEIARINDRNLINRVRTDADRYGSADSVGSAEGEPGRDALAMITSRSERAAYLTVSAVGNTVGDLPPSENGFTISRRIVDRFGHPVDPDAIRQNDLLVVIIEGRRLGQAGGQTTVADMLPGGFEIQNVKFDGNDTTDNLAWLGELSTLQQVEYRDDRFVATADISRYYWTYQGQFRMAYMVRAVTPGEFTMAGIYVEDLFRPSVFSRGPATRIRILPFQP